MIITCSQFKLKTNISDLLVKNNQIDYFCKFINQCQYIISFKSKANNYRSIKFINKKHMGTCSAKQDLIEKHSNDKKISEQPTTDGQQKVNTQILHQSHIYENFFSNFTFSTILEDQLNNEQMKSNIHQKQLKSHLVQSNTQSNTMNGVIIKFTDLPYSISNNLKPLGTGGYGTVYKGLYMLNNKQIPVAIKVFKESVYIAMQERKNQLMAGDRERFFLDQLYVKKEGQQNVVKFIDYFLNNQNPILIMQLCQNNLSFIMQSNQLDAGDRVYIIDHLLKGLNYIHNCCKIVHFDIKPKNILMAQYQEQSNKYILNYVQSHIIKYGDFGFSVKIDQFLNLKELTTRGTYNYMAPQSFLLEEIVKQIHKEQNQTIFKQKKKKFIDSLPKIDIWSFGCTVLKLITNVQFAPGFKDTHKQKNHIFYKNRNQKYRFDLVNYPNIYELLLMGEHWNFIIYVTMSYSIDARIDTTNLCRVFALFKQELLEAEVKGIKLRQNKKQNNLQMIRKNIFLEYNQFIYKVQYLRGYCKYYPKINWSEKAIFCFYKITLKFHKANIEQLQKLALQKFKNDADLCKMLQHIKLMQMNECIDFTYLVDQLYLSKQKQITTQSKTYKIQIVIIQWFNMIFQHICYREELINKIRQFSQNKEIQEQININQQPENIAHLFTTFIHEINKVDQHKIELSPSFYEENFNENFQAITKIINTLPSSKPKPEENNNNCS